MLHSAFYADPCMLCTTSPDPSSLQLPDRELASGISEIIKYGLIRDADLFAWLEDNMDALLARDPQATTYAIERSCVNKAEVVAQDEREGGVRATLNLGHTFGHAIETATGYGSWLHGEAVAAGMAMAADMSVRLGWVDGSIRDRCSLHSPQPPQAPNGALKGSWLRCILHIDPVTCQIPPQQHH